MSVRCMSLVYKMELPWVQKFVLLTLAWHADDSGTNSFPSVATICSKTSLDRRTVQRALKDLRDKRILLVETASTPKCPTVYRIAFSQGSLFPGGASERRPKGRQTVAQGRQRDAGGASDSRAGASERRPIRPEPSYNRPEREEKPPPVSLARDIPPTHPFAQIWQEEHGSLPGIEKLTPSRLRNCQRRAKQYTPEQFREAVIRCRASPFLSGKNDRGWKANFDFLIRNDRNISRVLEGEFDGTAQTKSDQRLVGNLEAAKRFLERHGEADRRLAGAVRHALTGRSQ